LLDFFNLYVECLTSVRSEAKLPKDNILVKDPHKQFQANQSGGNSAVPRMGGRDEANGHICVPIAL